LVNRCRVFSRFVHTLAKMTMSLGMPEQAIDRRNNSQAFAAAGTGVGDAAGDDEP
jgi:hypothetical protein